MPPGDSVVNLMKRSMHLRISKRAALEKPPREPSRERSRAVARHA
jgi:hypothetical protein